MKENSNISNITIIGNTTWGQAIATLINKEKAGVQILCRTELEAKNRINKIDKLKDYHKNINQIDINQNSNIIESLGGRLNNYFLTTKHNYSNEKDSKESRKIYRLDYIHGTSIFLHKNIIENIGYLDENYYEYNFHLLPFSLAHFLNACLPFLLRHQKIMVRYQLIL